MASQWEQATLDEMRAECREKPKNLPLRLELGDALMEHGDARAALEVYREALRLKPTYGKAQRKVADAEDLVAETLPAEPVCSALAASDAPDDAEAEVVRLKSRGNEHFNNQCFELAWDCYTDAIDRLKAASLGGDGKLHTNRAACLLTAERWVPAAFDGQRSIELLPDWWKGYWYHGQAILGQLKGKRPTAAMKQKGEVALRSLERASQCTGFPEDKRERVELLQARARNIVFYLAQNQCPQS